MTNSSQKGQNDERDVAEKSPAEGERPEGIPAGDRGRDPGVDPADKEQAEGDRE